jgi:tetratricopeptide (TPR) repeat protein
MPDRPDSDLEDVFRDFRDEVSRDSEATETERQFKLGLTYRDMGMPEDAIRELGRAARSPRRRFEAASLVARLQRDRGELDGAIEWFERAAEAPAPSLEAGRELLFELAQTLERAGESARALAVYLELRTDAGNYRDVSARIDRLSRLQSGR